ncbi:MAG TPA: IPT/TIG domain-containing protein [Bryobacteraceae bacterium]|nr:IPT/TIG domain-containing protein [Bryobacteraceae bacterium]
MVVSRTLIFALSIPAFSQVTVQAVTDAAAFGPRVAPGSIATIFGTNLANTSAQASGYPLPTTLGGTTVTVEGIAAPLFYVSSDTINFQVPSATPTGSATLTVQAPGGTSAAFTFTVLPQAPAIFQSGTNHAVAQNSDGSTNSDSNRAAAGSVLSVYFTGQGPVTNPVPDGTAAPSSPLSNSAANYGATIGLTGATVQFLGLAPSYAGLAQANIIVPNLATGDYPLVINIGGIVSTSAIVSISGSGSFTSPLALAGFAPFTSANTSSTALLNNTVYVCGSNQITMVDVSNPAQPKVAGSFGSAQLNGQGTICAVNPNTSPPILVDVVGAYALNSNMALAVYSLAKNQSPALLTVAATPYPYIVSLSFSGTAGFVSTSYFSFYTSSLSIFGQTGEFAAFDFTNPSAPQFVSVLSPNSITDQELKPYSAAIDATGFAYIASSTGTGSNTGGTGVIDVVSIATPSAMYGIEQVPVSPAAIILSFDVSGNTLLACGNTTENRNPGNPNFGFTGDLTLTVMDISAVETPLILNSIQTNLQVNGTFYTAAFSNGVFAIVNNAPVSDYDGPPTLMIVDARTPSNLILYPVQSQFGFGGMVATSGGYLLAGSDLGLYVYKLQL